MYIDRRLIFLIIALMLFSSFITLFSNRGALLSFVLSIPGILIAITFHEFAHAFAADKLGDDTPRRQGRLNLNPFKHLDPFGTIMLVFAGFGWGKPVEINPRNFNRDISLSKAEAIVAAAGPIMNLIIAVVFEIILCLVVKFAPGFEVIGGTILASNQVWGMVASVISGVISINIGLGIFNLIPLPPLDGSKVIMPFLPFNAKQWFINNEQIFYIIFVVLWITGLTSYIITPGIQAVGGWISNLAAAIWGL